MRQVRPFIAGMPGVVINDPEDHRAHATALKRCALSIGLLIFGVTIDSWPRPTVEGDAIMADQNQRSDQLKLKYQSVLSFIQDSGVRLSHVHIQDNKLFIQGEAPSEQVKNQVWDRIKAVDSSYSDLTADLTVNSALAAAQSSGSAAAGGMQTYTVKAGDSLSKISEQFYGTAGQYMKIFEANRDKLTDANKIQPGQVLKIPQS